MTEGNGNDEKPNLSQELLCTLNNETQHCTLSIVKTLTKPITTKNYIQCLSNPFKQKNIWILKFY